MPTFTFTAPDGKKYTVNGPEGATEQQAFQLLQSQLGTPAAPAAPKPAPEKQFGEQLKYAMDEIPRQTGLAARYAIEGVGGTLNFMATPFRAASNLLTPSLKPTLEDQVRGTRPPERFRPYDFAGVANSLGLPQPQNKMERVVGDATRMLAGAAVPIAAAGNVAKNSAGVTQGVATMMAARPAQQFVSAGAAGAAGGYTRETGGGQKEQFVASLAAGLAAPYAMGKAQQAATALRAAPASQMQIDIQVNNALQQSGIVISDLPASIQAGIRQDVAKALQTTGNLNPDAVRRLADYRLVGAMPSAAGLSLDPAIVTQQKNLAKLGINSKDAAAQQLGQMANQNNSRLITGINELGAGRAGTAYSGGQRIMGALEQRNELAKGLIGQKYDAARATGGRSADLDPYAFTQKANNLLDDALLGGKLPGDVRNLLNSAASGKMPLTVDVAEQFKTRIGDLQRSTMDMAERKALGLVRQALDDAPLLPGQQMGQQSIDAFNKARQINRAWMGIVDKTPALKAVRDGMEPDKFVQQFITGGGGKANVADVKALYSSIKSNPDAMQAVKEQITGHLKAKALNGAADEVGALSQSAYNKALNQIGDDKLRLFFTKSEVDQMKAIGRVASYEQFQPVGSAVNNSNTAGTLMANILDRIAGSNLLSKIPFGNALQQPAQNIVVGMQARKVLDVPNALAGPRIQPPASAHNRLMISPALLMGAEDK